jgi:hypothetical protein
MDVDVEGLEDDVDPLILTALGGFLDGDIDERTLGCVLALHDDWAEDVLDRAVCAVSAADGRRINSVWHRHGRGRPVFDWQPVRAVRDGHSALREGDTRRFAAFITRAWRKNRPVGPTSGDPRRFRDIELAQGLHSCAADLPGNCLIHYFGP